MCSLPAVLLFTVLTRSAIRGNKHLNRPFAEYAIGNWLIASDLISVVEKSQLTFTASVKRIEIKSDTFC